MEDLLSDDFRLHTGTRECRRADNVCFLYERVCVSAGNAVLLQSGIAGKGDDHRAGIPGHEAEDSAAGEEMRPI